MTIPDDKRKPTPRERFRNILSAEEAEESPREPRKPAVVNLPKVGGVSGPPNSTPRMPRTPEVQPRQNLSASTLQRTFWTVGGILSILANAVLLTMLAGGYRTSSAAAGLAGLYAGLEQLDNAHIRTTVPLNTSLSLDATVPVKTSTRITLARDLLVRGAHVTINGAGLSIDSPADITLPAGTELDVNLDLELPLQGALPVTAEVPVDIAIRDTDVHAGIRSLKEALQPLVCANAPTATLSDGTPICR